MALVQKVQRDAERSIESRHLVGEDVQGLLIERVRPGVDDFEVTRILLLSPQLRNEGANRGLNELRAAATIG